MDNIQQILPGFAVLDDAYFESFYISDEQRLLVNSLQQFVRDDAEDFVYLCGRSGLGKTHLLKAVCDLAERLRKSSRYVLLSDVQGAAPSDILSGHLAEQFLCLDNLDAICGNRQWEVALFDLYNQRIAAGLATYFSASKPAIMLEIELADLQSRLAAVLSFQLVDMSDLEKIALLRFRAAQRGIDINDGCLSYIILRSGRDVSVLMDVLQRLDRGSLAAGRKITVPFIKSVMGW